MQNFSVFNLVVNKVTAGFQRVNSYTPIQLYISLPLFLLSFFIPAFWPTKPCRHSRIFPTPYRTVPDVLLWWIWFGMKSLGRNTWQYLTFIPHEKDSYVRRRRQTQVFIEKQSLRIYTSHHEGVTSHITAWNTDGTLCTARGARYCKTVRVKHRCIIWSVTKNTICYSALRERMHYKRGAWRLAGKQVLSRSLEELGVRAAACVSFLLLVKMAFLSWTCYPPILQAKRAGTSNTIDMAAGT